LLTNKGSFLNLIGVLPYTLLYLNEAIYELDESLYSELSPILYKEMIELLSKNEKY